MAEQARLNLPDQKSPKTHFRAVGLLNNTYDTNKHREAESAFHEGV